MLRDSDGRARVNCLLKGPGTKQKCVAYRLRKDRWCATHFCFRYGMEGQLTTLAHGRLQTRSMIESFCRPCPISRGRSSLPGRLHMKQNLHDTREAWLRSATRELTAHFLEHGYQLPDKIRFAIAFTSTGRKGRIGECWDASISDDKHYEIFIRADLADPVEVLGVLVKELVHTLLPIEAGHGKEFKAVALKIGLAGAMRRARPGPLLQKRLSELAANLGPLPHARLNIERGVNGRISADKPKKQTARLLKAECDAPGCGYNVRLVSKWVKLGPPGCPVHGPMKVTVPSEPGPEDEAGPDEPPAVPAEAV